MTVLYLLPLLAAGQIHYFDIVVYGGTSAGITSAVEAARNGKTVALIEPSAHIGGIAVEGLGGTDIDNHKEFQNSIAVGGLALEFYRRIAKAYNREEAFEAALRKSTKETKLWRFESHVAEQVYNDWVSEYNIKVFLRHRLAENRAVKKTGTVIEEIVMENKIRFKGKVFIDATYEGDLLYHAGVSTVIGREPNSLHNETLNGIRPETTHAQFEVKVDPYIIPGDSSSGVIHTVQNEGLGIPGSGDHRIQAYCFRMCLTKEPGNKIHFTRPLDYDRSHYEIYVRYEKAGGKLYTPSPSIPNGKTDLGAWHDLSHNLYGMNFDYPAGSYATRQKVLAYHRDFTQGLFYFLANDTAISERTRNEWSQWGLARDEFTDNEGWPRNFYVRDARRMVSDYIITENHAKKNNAIPVEDPVALAYWPTDVHSVRRIVKDGFVYNEGFVFGGDYWKPFGISYRSLVPKETECTNILTPTCPSSTHIAYGAIRIEFTFMGLGQAAGLAANMAADENKPVQKIDYSLLRKQLLSAGQRLALYDQ